MTMIRSAVLIGGLGLSACVQTGPTGGGSGGGGGGGPTGAQVTQQFQAFAKDAYVAEQIAQECPTLALRTSTDVLVQGFVEQMVSAGVTAQDLLAAQQAMTPDQIAASGAADLTSAGVRQDDPGSFCAYGQAQVQAGTRVGSFLA